jgi:DNA-binding XRE family transcriptional regulator
LNKIARFTTPSGDEMVVMSEADFQALVNDAEMSADVAAYDRVKDRLARGEDELIPADFVHRMLDGESRVAVWREFRGLSARALAETAGITQAYLSQIEAGKRDGTVGTMKKIAEALKITVDDLI